VASLSPLKILVLKGTYGLFQGGAEVVPFLTGTTSLVAPFLLQTHGGVCILGQSPKSTG